MSKNPFLQDEEIDRNPFLESTTTTFNTESLVAPITGQIGGGFNDERSGGARKHLAIDYQAPAGTEFVAPTDLVYLRGGVGGTNLRANDRWAHFGIPGTDVEWRIAHQGELPEPGTTFKQGDVVGTVGNVISGPHLHAGFVDTNTGEHIDIGSQLGLSRGLKIEAGKPLNPFIGTERKMEVVAGKVNPFLIETDEATNPFLARSKVLETPIVSPQIDNQFLNEPTFAPTKEQAEASAKASGVDVEPGLEQPTFLDPINIAGGLPAIGRATTGSLLSGVATKPGLVAMAKALPGFLGSEAVGGAVYSGLEGDKSVPEWAKLPLALAAGVGGGLATSKIGELGAAAKLRAIGGQAPIPPEDVILSEVTSRLTKGMSAQDALKEISEKYGRTVQDIISKPTTPGVTLGAPIATKVVKDPLDSSELGAPVVTRSIKTNVDSTLGPKGTVVDTIPLNEGHVTMREAFNAKGVDLTPPRLMSWKNTFKTNERIFSELDDIAPGFQDEFWGKMKQSENIAHKDTKVVFQEIDDIASKMGKGTGNKIGIDLIAQRRGGLERLERMGITPEPLSIEEIQVANDFQIKFHDYLVRINDARALAGKQPIREDPNYITFMSNFVNKVTEGVNPIAANPNVFAIPSSTPFRFEKALKGSKEAIETDLFKVFKNYAALAERHINISPHLEKIRKFLGPMTLPDGTKIAPLAKDAPNAAVALAYMAQTISGVKSPMSKLEKLLVNASNNLVISTLGAYPKSVMNQMGSLAAGGAEVGPVNLIRGFLQLLKPGMLKFTTEASDALAQRKMDIVLEELGSSWLKGAFGKVKHVAMLPLELVDDLMARGVWLGGVKKGLQMGLSEEGAQKFADKIVVRTQASASPIDRAMIQRSAAGKIATAFQTFSIADANWIARNILGQGNINFKTTEGFTKLAKMTVVGLALNYIQRDVLGMPPGLPEPFHAMEKAKSEGAGKMATAWEGTKEFAPFVPVLGSIAYGKVPGGAIGGLVADTVSGAKSPAESLAMLAGFPGMNMILKGLKTPSGRELLSNIESKTGLPVGPRTKLTGPPLTMKDILFGRDQRPQKRKPWRID
jgi:hypothetical protein